MNWYPGCYVAMQPGSKLWSMQGNFKGESVVAAIFPSSMQVSFCTYRFFRS